MTLADFLKNKKLVAEYKKWINADIAIVVTSVLQEEFCRPITPNQIGEKITKNTSDFLHGENCGSWKTLDALRGLDQQKVAKSEVPAETYGTESETETKK